MFIVINCLGMPFNGDTINHESLGGSETAAYYMARELAKQGHRVSVYTNMKDPSKDQGEFDGVKYIWAGNQTEGSPLGERFHFFAQQTPHDVLIIQRHPLAFRFRYAAKINLWWVHDLATMRQRELVRSHLWNIDGILTVSEWHKKQYAEVYGINPEVIYPIQNGVDLSLFNGCIDYSLFEKIQHSCDSNASLDDSNIVEDKVDELALQVKLLYTSRPERGLEHLVAHNGIMERLAKLDPNYHLYVCAYDNVTPQMVDYYQYLALRCDQLPNVTVLGSLTKQELADVMRQCDALVYPTPGPKQPNFDEVSCITAMECMAAGLPMITSKRGALPETTKGAGVRLVRCDESGIPKVEDFVKAIVSFFKGSEAFKVNAKNAQLEAAKRYTWDRAADMLLDHVRIIFEKSQSPASNLRHLIHTSDIYAAEKYAIGTRILNEGSPDAIFNNACIELDECYQFAWNHDFKEHYRRYYEYEAKRGVEYGPEDLTNNPRFSHVAGLISNLPDGSSILDYGCAHGHYTVNLAKAFPGKFFVGVDIEATNISKAREWAKKEGVTNVSFINSEIDSAGTILIDKETEPALEGVAVPNDTYDAIIAAEVIEHIEDPNHYVMSLSKLLKSTGQMIITVPIGPWEAQGYVEHHPWRAHLWHFERGDLHELWGHFPEFKVMLVPAGASKWGTPLGSYVVTFEKPTNQVGGPNIKPKEIGTDGLLIPGRIDYERKFRELKPIQTVSVCMIAHNAEATILRCLESVKDFASEIIVAIDRNTTDGTTDVVEQFARRIQGMWPVVKIIDTPSPLDIGFDEARNNSIKDASGDWILWIDDDEILVFSERIHKYLRNSGFDGYAIKQHHFSAEPLGIHKTDMPCRLFRNHKGVQFYGVVHEHPEKKLNEGVGYVQLIPDIEIAHEGYTTEAIRRQRFQRNISLLVRDREKYPKRKLGRFLWFRDLAQMSKYELEINGGRITAEMRQRAQDGMKIWEELLAENELRMIVDGIEFYDIMSRILGGGFDFGFVMDSSKANGGIHLEQAKPVVAHFASKEHVIKLMNALTTEKVKDYGHKHF